MDVLLRVLRDVPGGLEYLRKHAAWPCPGTRMSDSLAREGRSKHAEQ